MLHRTVTEKYRMLADAIMLGVIIQQFTHWWEYARADDKPVVRSIVVSPSSTSALGALLKGPVLFRVVQHWSFSIVGTFLTDEEQR